MANVSSNILNNINILSLRCFVSVAETQSFSAAARQLRLAPSSVTKHVQGIERAINAALFHRTTRRVSVTEAGERFYEHCLEILAQIDSASAVVDSGNLSGHLRITAPPSFSAAILGPRLHEFMAAHPALSIDVSVDSGTPDLIRNRIDVSISLQQEPQSKLTHFLLTRCALILCASPDYIARRGMPKRPDDLIKHDCVAGRHSDLTQNWTLSRKNGGKNSAEVVNPHFKLLSDNGDLLRQASLGGAGIGIFYNFHVRNDLRAGRLVPLLTDYELRSRNMFAIIPHHKLIRPQAGAFIDFVRSLVSDSADFSA